MYEIKADKSKNRLYIKVNGTIASREIEEYATALNEAVESLTTGFTALLDLKKTCIFNRDSMKKLQGTKNTAVAAGLKKSAMVLDSTILKMQMNVSYKEVGPRDEAFSNIDEAEAFLDE